MLVFLQKTMTEMTLRMLILHGRREWGYYGLSRKGGANTKEIFKSLNRNLSRDYLIVGLNKIFLCFILIKHYHSTLPKTKEGSGVHVDKIICLD